MLDMIANFNPKLKNKQRIITRASIKINTIAYKNISAIDVRAV